MSYKVTLLTDKAFLLKRGGQTDALVSLGGDKIQVFHAEQTVEFDDIEALCRHYNIRLDDDFLAQKEEAKEIIREIDGYPVSHANVTVVEGSDPPRYLSTGREYYVGYWAVFEKGQFRDKFCPPVGIVDLDRDGGPFKSRTEMRIKCKELNRKAEQHDAETHFD